MHNGKQWKKNNLLITWNKIITRVNEWLNHNVMINKQQQNNWQCYWKLCKELFPIKLNFGRFWNANYNGTGRKTKKFHIRDENIKIIVLQYINLAFYN